MQAMRKNTRYVLAFLVFSLALSLILNKYFPITVTDTHETLQTSGTAIPSEQSAYSEPSGSREDQEVAPMVALTFDDGPNLSYTPQLLDGLKERNIQATFFLIGENIDGAENLVLRMQQEGHLVGNHTYSHVQLTKLSETAARQEIEKTSNRIYEITGTYPQFLRPPYGSWPKNLDFAVEMFPVLWSIDTLDWQSQNISSILQIVQNEVKDGSIILMHDAYPTSVEAALKIVDRLTDQGYTFVTVDKLINSV
jgi:peptidoglycan/xylan/chitin deacetylase (PgdA/CDA1 family)